MIVVGVDVHKHCLTAVAVDEVGRPVAEQTVGDGRVLLEWAASLSEERLWALEDCRQLSRQLERTLQVAGERLVRVPPKLMAPSRRAGRVRGKSDPIDALAVARAALREPRLDHPRPGEERLRELKLLVDHRDDLVDERRRAQQRLRWHLHELDPTLVVPSGALDRAVWLDRLARRLARNEQKVLVRIARELVGRCRSPTRTILALDRELEQRTSETAPALNSRDACLGHHEPRQAATTRVPPTRIELVHAV
jgi:transposase